MASTHRPCTKGLWMWSAPIKITALDRTEYSLLLLDSEGIDAYDQTVWRTSMISFHFHAVFFLFYRALFFPTNWKNTNHWWHFPPLLQGTYSIQIFSLAVLLSSMFIYNQVWAMVSSFQPFCWRFVSSSSLIMLELFHVCTYISW